MGPRVLKETTVSERYVANIVIGGSLPKIRLPELLKAVQEAAVSIEWGDAPLNPQSEQDLLSAIDEGQLWLCDDQTRNGEFPELETACRELGLSYTRQSEGYCGYDAEVADWRPEMEEPLVRVGSNSGNQTYVPAEEVRKALAHLESNHIGRARELLRTLCPDIPELPAFQIT